MTTAWAVSVVATVLSIPLQGAYAVGGALGDVLSTEVIADELGTRTGRSWVVRLILLAVAAVVLPRLARLGGRAARTVAVVGGLALLTTVTLTGHAVSGDLVPLAVVTDIVHLAGVSVWLGRPRAAGGRGAVAPGPGNARRRGRRCRRRCGRR